MPPASIIAPTVVSVSAPISGVPSSSQSGTLPGTGNSVTVRPGTGENGWFRAISLRSTTPCAITSKTRLAPIESRMPRVA